MLEKYSYFGHQFKECHVFVIISKHVDDVLSGFDSKGKNQRDTAEFIFSSIFCQNVTFFYLGLYFKPLNPDLAWTALPISMED